MKIDTLKKACRANDAASFSAEARREPTGMGIHAACREAGVSREDVMYVAEQRALMYVTRTEGQKLPKPGEPYSLSPMSMAIAQMFAAAVLDGILIGLRASKIEAYEASHKNEKFDS